MYLQPDDGFMKLIYGTRFSIRPRSIRGAICYLGFDFKKKSRVDRLAANTLDISTWLSQVANEIKMKFIDYIAEVGSEEVDKMKWWASRIASKSNLQTDFFSIVVLSLIARKIYKEKKCDCIVVSDVRLFSLLRSNFSFTVDSWDSVSALFAGCFLRVSLVCRALLTRIFFVVRRLPYKGRVRTYCKPIVGAATYVYSWVEDRSFDANGNYNDPYLPSLSDLAPDARLILLCPYYVRLDLYSRFSKDLSITSLSLYSNWKNIVKSASTVFNPKPRWKFDDLDLRVLWGYEILSENSNRSFVANIHDYHCWKGFFAGATGKILYPYENQPWEKVMILAANDLESRVTFIAYQHSSIGSLLIPYHTTDKEASIMPIPHLIVTNSEKNREVLGKYYRNVKTQVLNGGALRYPRRTVVRRGKIKGNKRVGVMLPVDYEQALELIDQVNRSHFGRLSIMVKCHPDTPFPQAVFEKHVVLFRGTADELYRSVNAVVYCSSTCGMEAFSRGLKVFRFQGQFIDLELGEDSFSPIVITSLQEIENYDLKSHQPRNLFGQPDKELWARLLQHTSSNASITRK
jgi:hypothetical protein